MNKILKEVFDPINVFITVFNILLFFILMFLWFWFIASNQLYSVISIKAAEINNIAKNEVVLDKMVETLIETYRKDETLIKKVSEDIKIRNAENISMVSSYILPPIIIFLLLTIFYGSYIYVFKYNYWGLPENVLIIFMFLGFITEIVLYFMVIENFHYIANSTILKLILIKE